jgi:C4-dicarboxylate-specific signal transduction histidine kinase
VPALATAYELLKRAEALLNLERTHGELFEKNAREIRELADRVTRLESRLEIMVAEAKGAAASAASAALAQSLLEIGRRLGVLVERTRNGRNIEGPPGPE